VIWFVLWSVLVVGTVLGGFFLLRHVYRSGKTLVAELGRAAEVFERLEERTAELAAAAEAAHPVEPVTIDDPERARRIWAAAAEVKAGRRARRDARREATYRRWLSFSR
jgi:hypothetical protein